MVVRLSNLPRSTPQPRRDLQARTLRCDGPEARPGAPQLLFGQLQDLSTAEAVAEPSWIMPHGYHFTPANFVD